MVLVLLGVSIFAVASSQTTAHAATSAGAASRLSDAYDEAATAVANEESLERKYRLEPGPDVRARFYAAGTALTAALATVRSVGAAADRALVDRVMVQHTAYVAAIDEMFTAVDAYDPATVLRIDGTEVDPVFDGIERTVDAAADAQHSIALQRLSQLQRLERDFQMLTPVVFGLGLLLAASLAMGSRGYRRILARERAQAVDDSHHDALTGLPNRGLLTARVAEWMLPGQRSGRHSAIVLMDLDRFKEVNDTFGHDYGDHLLVQVGPRLQAVVGGENTVARLGGDEFGVLLTDVVDISTATDTARRLRDALEAPFQVQGIDLDIEASVGVALSGVHGHDAQTLLQRADIAMYTAKTQNLGVAVYHPDFDGHSPAKLALVGELRTALQRRELLLHFQPKISVDTGELVGVEALLRWRHPTRGLVYPDEFIPVAEHTGLIGPLTRYILDAALAQTSQWADTGRPVRVAVNLSARNLLDEQLADDIATAMTDHQVPATLLDLEITESAVITEPVRAHRVLQQLVDLGTRIVIDDFGAGYTSLGQLRTLPVSAMKIDRSFVMTMTDTPADARLVATIIDLGHDLGLTVIAEGVESEDALDMLRRLGCDQGQGYYISRPMPAHAFERWIADRRTDRMIQLP